MEIKKEYPPNIEEIRKVFDIGERSVVFTYGDVLYNPTDCEIEEHLFVHEKTHIEQQKGLGPQKWWDKYLTDKDFRLSQEVEAYGNQYRFAKNLLNSEGQKIFLHEITSDLSSEIYGNMISYSKAESLIRHNAKEEN